MQHQLILLAIHKAILIGAIITPNYTSPIITPMAQWLRRWIPNPEVPCSKPLGGSKVDSAFHPSEVDKVSSRNFWELSGKK